MIPLSDPNVRHLCAPANYVQQPGLLGGDDAARQLETLDCNRAIVVGGESALAAVGGNLREALGAADIEVVATDRGRSRCTTDIISSGAASVEETGADLLVGVGGGTVIDATKGMAMEAAGNPAVVTVPTVASTNAPSSSVAVVYDEAGRVVESPRRFRNPELVLVDTAVIADAPVRFLRHGMGDALATRFEAEAVSRSGGTTSTGGTPSGTARALARRCYTVLSTRGPDALEAVERGTLTPAVETAVETVVLTSAIGFESGGLAAAHSFHQGFRDVGVPDPHGVVVAFGTVAQLALEDHDELDDVVGTVLELGLDHTLSEFGVADDELPTVAERACAESMMENEPVDVTPDRAEAAIRRADELIRERR